MCGIGCISRQPFLFLFPRLLQERQLSLFFILTLIIFIVQALGFLLRAAPQLKWLAWLVSPANHTRRWLFQAFEF
jgi:hypothetical protein